MGSHFPLTAKRQLSASGEMESGGTSPRSHRRPKTLPPPIAVPDGHSAFRLLCPASKVGGVIGKSGAIVDAIRRETGSKIRVEESVPTCDERVILVVGPGVPNRQIRLAAGDPAIVSAAQEALVRVFDRILEADQEHEKTDPISCRMLAVSAQVGALMGKGGRNIDSIRKESGCKVRVLPMDQLPQCAAPSDELIQITGNGLGIKKALVAISSCLQDNSQSVKAQLVNNSHVTLSNTHEDLLFQRSSLHPAIPGDFRDYDARDHPAYIGVDRISKPERKTLQEISFKLLCSNDNIGGVIGKGGTIVRALQNETTASIACSASVAESDERVINVSASENPDLQFSPAQNALLRVFNRSIEVGIERGMKPVSQITARLLVPANQIGCLMGKGGVIMQEITKISGASIQIIRGDQVPRCASEKEEVVQITGELGNVRDALFHVTNRLRNNVFSTYLLKNAEAPVVSSTLLKIPSYGRVGPTLGWYPSMGAPSSLEFQTTTAQSMDHFAISSMNLSSPPRVLSSQKFGATADFENGLRARRGGFGSGDKAAIVTKTTVDIAVPASAFGYVYGKNGSNLSQMRQISGAMVEVHDPAPGASEGMVIISGTPQQTQAAQSLLQSFITSG